MVQNSNSDHTVAWGIHLEHSSRLDGFFHCDYLMPIKVLFNQEVALRLVETSSGACPHFGHLRKTSHPSNKASLNGATVFVQEHLGQR